MTTPTTPDKCRALGVCRLPHGHTGLCSYGKPPLVGPPSVAKIGTRNGEVVIDFGVPGPWTLILTPKQAVEVGAAVLRRGYRLLLDLAAGDVTNPSDEVH
jgi:hypothetical protein